MKKYKLIKRFTDGPKLGTVYTYVESDDLYEPVGDIDCDNFYSSEIEDFPELWAKYVFTTEDDVDIFVSDPYYEVYIPKPGRIVSRIACEGDKLVNDHKTYSSEYEAQKYLDSLNKFEEGVWYQHISENIGLYLDKKGNVGFDAVTEEWVEDIDMEKPEQWKKADMKEVEKLLVVEAKRRYPEKRGKFIITYSGNVAHRLHYDDLECIFHKGKWVAGEKRYYGVCPYSFEIIMSDYVLGEERKDEYNKNTKWFDTEEERDDYIRLNKPQYSQKDLLDYGEYMLGEEVNHGSTTYYTKHHLENWSKDNNDKRF